MIRFLFRASIAALALPIAGCNVVMSDHPWFAAGTGDTHLAPGLWVALKDQTCAFDATAALPAWPECARPFFVRGQELLSPPEAKDGETPTVADLARWDASPIVLAPGNPMVIELPARMTQPGVEPAAGKEDQPKLYLYLAVQPQGSAADGNLQAVRVWPVFCGPPPPPPPKGATQSLADLGSSGVSARPFPGLHKAKMGCAADNADSIRKAAALSEGVAVANQMPPFTAHWLRTKLEP